MSSADRSDHHQELRRRVARTSGDLCLAFLDDNDFRIDKVERLRGGMDYFAFLRLTSQLSTSLGVRGDELLFLGLHNRRQQQWFLEEIRGCLGRFDRLTKTAVIVASKDPGIRKLCEKAFASSATGYKTAHVALTFEEIDQAHTQFARRNLLLNAFRAQAFSVDHFDTRSPVPDDLFGRTSLLAQLEADARSRNEGIALLGVRRVGKTSVLKKALQQLSSNPDDRRLLAYYDAQADSVDASSDVAAKRLFLNLQRSAEDAKIRPSVDSASATALQRLRQLIDVLIQDHKASVLIAVDEIEWLIPSNIAGNLARKVEDYIRFSGFLRSLKQEYGARIALVLCGINESFCETPDFGGLPNPGLDWYVPHYVRLLSKDDTATMLNELASRMGLFIAPEFMEEAWKAFAGHPYLARQFCSEVARSVSARPMTLKKQDFARCYQQFIGRAKPIFDAILKHFATFYPGEYDLLRLIARDGNAPSGNLGVAHLLDYGLVAHAPGGKLTLTMSALMVYVMTHTVEEVRRDRFKLLQRLGSGATGAVWRAWDAERQRECALKIYDLGSHSSLGDGEFNVLRAIGSSYVPEAFELIKFNDQSALAMELVRGRTLHDVLAERKFLVGEDIVALAESLFVALESIHPHRERIEELRRTSQISEEHFEELQELLVSGYLHRDLKPANIVIEDERTWKLRMVDLQLAKPVAQAQRSRVGTPAYCPPDWGVAPWDESFDLFALGCILFEAAVGQPPNLLELHAQLALRLTDEAYRKAALAFFERALQPSSADRFSSIAEMRSQWAEACVGFI